MKIRLLPLILVLLMTLSCTSKKKGEKTYDYPITPVEFTQVVLNDGYWKPWLEINRTVTIPSSFQKCEGTGRVDNFKVAGGLMEGAFRGVFPFDDSDVYKIIEGGSYSLSSHPDQALDAYMDTLISYIALAQEDDGYLQTWRTIDPTKPPTSWSGGPERWSDISGGHELYNMGHMYEAAVAHYKATGKKSFLDIATKNAELIVNTFGPGKIETPTGHQEIEIGLVKLYRVSGKKEYLELAKFFLDQRGHVEGREASWGEYSQDHMPVQEQSEAVGHAVRAGYMYSAMADIAAITGDTAYIHSLERIWNNVVGKKIYLTGGIGARHSGESFGDNYELPNLSAYNETCAAIANIFWNHRMFLLTGKSKYIDVLERTLYNGMIVGVSLSGNSFFYPNPLESDGSFTFNNGSCSRSPWFDCSCCPSNVTRFIPSIPGYLYAVKDKEIFVNLYTANSATMKVNGTEIQLSQQTKYPWSNKVIIGVTPKKTTTFDLKLRIPGWARNEVMASDLYYYVNKINSLPIIKINKEPIQASMADGYAVLSREWKKGDIVEMELPMEIRQVAANENVEADKGKIAIEYGPIVYCAEEADNELDVLTTSILLNSEFRTIFNPEILRGIPLIIAGPEKKASGAAIDRKSEITMIPYNVWNNRGVGKMAVWFDTE